MARKREEGRAASESPPESPETSPNPAEILNEPLSDQPAQAPGIASDRAPDRKRARAREEGEPPKKRKGGGNGARAARRAEKLRGQIAALPDEALVEIANRLRAEQARRAAGGKKYERGNLPIEFSQKDRDMVEALAGHGIPRDQIAALITNPATGRPIHVDTLEENFSEELSIGVAKINAKIAQSLARMATGTPAQYNAQGQRIFEAIPPNVTAAIYWTKARMGWREASIFDKLLEDSELDRAIQQIEAAIVDQHGPAAIIDGNAREVEALEGASGKEAPARGGKPN